MATPIQELAEHIIKAPLGGKMTGVIALRNYIRGLTDEQFLKEVERVTNPEVIRYFISSGLNMYRLEAASMKWRELTR